MEDTTLSAALALVDEFYVNDSGELVAQATEQSLPGTESCMAVENSDLGLSANMNTSEPLLHASMASVPVPVPSPVAVPSPAPAPAPAPAQMPHCALWPDDTDTDLTMLNSMLSPGPATSEAFAWPTPQQEAATSQSQSTSTNLTLTAAGPVSVALTARHNRVTTLPAESTARPRKRNRRRDELVYLRATVQELQKQLGALTERSHGTQGQQMGGPVARVKSAKEELASALLTPVWEELAGRQSAQRHRAESENIKLRGFLAEQLKVAKSLESLLKKRNHLELLSIEECATDKVDVKRARWKVEPHATEQPLMETDQLHAGLVGMYEQIPKIFSDSRFQSSDNPHRVVEVRNDIASGTWIETLEARVLPFDFQSIGDAQWENSKRLYGRKGRAFVKVEETNDTVIKTFEGEIDFPHVSSVCRIQIIVRRFVEPDQIVLVWFLIVHPDSVAGTSMDGIMLQHQGWQVIRPVQGSNTKSGGRQASTSRVYQVAKPKVYGDISDKEYKIGAITDFVLSTIHFQLDFRYQNLENRLLEDMLA